MKEFIENNCYHIKYNSLGDFLYDTETDAFPSTAHVDNENDFDSIRSDRNNSWRYGGEDDQESYFDERFDSKKGKKLCEEGLRTVLCSKEYKDAVQLALTYKKRLNFTDEGVKLSVPRAITGEDRCFIKTKSARKPTVKIGVNLCVSACVEDDDLVKIATSAIPVVYALEQAGICTEIWLCAFSTGTHNSEHNDFRHTAVEVCVKTAQQRFNWTTFAPLFQVGTYRHGIFLTWTRAPYSLDCGFGRPMSESTMKENSNFGYVTIIGNNSPGPLSIIKEVFQVK